eukprot:TRINITY_DN17554_c0_g1_i1.p1 TRINITY_DN17554_c0_g1~~TRINITY_DN17554_c0_g1_i1.p1  ORF type:complete len:300 (-),score=42.80 TRINITY_DN17554_c0_g1_i1:63-962(-)
MDEPTRLHPDAADAPQAEEGRLGDKGDSLTPSDAKLAEAGQRDAGLPEGKNGVGPQPPDTSNPVEIVVEGQRRVLEVSDDPDPAMPGFGKYVIPLEDFPPLPSRGDGYMTEPIIICSMVTGFSIVLGALVLGTVRAEVEEFTDAVPLCLQAGVTAVAYVCAFAMLFGRHPDEIRRSAKNSYPLPDIVGKRLLECPREPLSQGMQNIPGPAGSSTLGTFCVRCLVWRPSHSVGGLCHHCSVCQRCVGKFDHHCGVIGRCITRRNMPFFWGLISMLPMGILSALLSVIFARMNKGAEEVPA